LEDQVKDARHFWKAFLKFYRRLPADVFTSTTRLRTEIGQAGSDPGEVDPGSVTYSPF
jgi:hypothetical protein